MANTSRRRGDKIYDRLSLDYKLPSLASKPERLHTFVIGLATLHHDHHDQGPRPSTHKYEPESSQAAALNTALGHLKEHRYQSASQELRQLVETEPPPPPGYKIFDLNTTTPLAISRLGAHISLANHELAIATGFAQLIEAQSRAQKMDDATLDVVEGLEKRLCYELPHIATILTSTPPDKISPAQVNRFYKLCTLQVERSSQFVHQVWLHCNILPNHKGIVSLLKFLVTNGLRSEAINLIDQSLKGHDFNSEHLPARIPIYLASDFLSYGIQAGATHQCLQIHEQASRMITHQFLRIYKQASGPITHSCPEQRELSRLMISQDPYAMPRTALTFIQHFVKLSKRSPEHLQGWHRAKFEEDPSFFFEYSREKDHEPEPGTLRANSYTATAIACLIQLGRFSPAFRMFSLLFSQNCEIHGELSSLDDPNMRGLGVNLPSLVDRVAQTLTNIIPTHSTSPQVDPRIYNIVIHQLTKRQRLDDAFALLISARTVGREDLDPKILDILVQASLDKLRHNHWPSRFLNADHWTSERIEAMARRKLLTFAQIQATFHFIGGNASIATVRRAIEVALEVERPKEAWEIRVWGNKMGIFNEKDTSKAAQNQIGFEQAREEDSSPQSIAQALLNLQRRGLMDRDELVSMLRGLGVDKELLLSDVDIDDNRVPAPTH